MKMTAKPAPLRASTVQHLVNVSGGKDSTAVYLRAVESGRPFRAVMADTGNEHELTHEYVARLHERTGGPKVEVVRADFSRQLARHRDYVLREWPKQGIAEFCTEELKTIPITTGPVADMLRDGPVLQWLGIRADESRNRAKQPLWNRHESGSMVWRPIFSWSVQENCNIQFQCPRRT